MRGKTFFDFRSTSVRFSGDGAVPLRRPPEVELKVAFGSLRMVRDFALEQGDSLNQAFLNLEGSLSFNLRVYRADGPNDWLTSVGVDNVVVTWIFGVR